MLLARRMYGCGQCTCNIIVVQCGPGRMQPVRTVIALLMLQRWTEHFYMHGGVLCITTTAIEGFCVRQKGDVCSVFLS